MRNRKDDFLDTVTSSANVDVEEKFSQSRRIKARRRRRRRREERGMQTKFFQIRFSRNPL